MHYRSVRIAAAILLLAAVATAQDPKSIEGTDTVLYSAPQTHGATVKSVDGTVFVDFLNPVPGMTYTFDVHLWTQAGGTTTTYPTAPVPLRLENLGADDKRDWFSVVPGEVTFDGTGTAPDPSSPSDPAYTGVPGGSFETVTVTLTVPETGLPDKPVMVALTADTSGNPSLDSYGGVIIRLYAADSPLSAESWLSDTMFVPMSVAYRDEFSVVTKGARVVSTNPGGFYYNVLLTTTVDVSELTVNIELPADFALWGANALHAWVNVFDVSNPDDETSMPNGQNLTVGPLNAPAGTTVFVTVHVRYALEELPSPSYLPRVYTFHAVGSGGGFEIRTSASMTGVRKK